MATYFGLALLGAKELLKICVVIYCAAKEDTPTVLRKLVGKSLFAPVMVWRMGFEEYEKEIVNHHHGTFGSTLLEVLVEGVCENFFQFGLQMHYIFQVSGDGLRTPWPSRP